MEAAAVPLRPRQGFAMHIFFSVGEPSGDQHAAELIHEIRRRCPDAEFSGYGGPQMEQAGFRKLFQLTDLAVMGFFAVVPLLGKFIRLARQARRYLREHRPDAVVLVDFPGFNWWIARAAKLEGIPVYYYMPPQLWAWAPWRIRRVHKYVDCVLAALPFEAKWYRDRNATVEYVGHPFFDEVAAHQLDADFCASLKEPGTRNVAILPGSRNQEVRRNFPVMLRVMHRLYQKHPDLRFRVASYREHQRDFCQSLLTGRFAELPIDFHVKRTSEIIETADCCLMVSGSVSLELLARATPAVVLYRAGWVMYGMAWLLATCKYISLPNLIADRVVMPEFPFTTNKGRYIRRMTEILDGWLSDEKELTAVRDDMAQLRDAVIERGGIAKAAEVILERIPQTQVRRRAA